MAAAADGVRGTRRVRRQQLAFSAELTSAAELIASVVARVRVRDLFVVEPSIEDVIRTLYTA
jgi:ABC-2 type transport system ATP-binding protein